MEITEKPIKQQINTEKMGANYLTPLCILAGAVIVALSILYVWMPRSGQVAALSEVSPEQIIPEKGVVLPIKWGNLGMRMINAGVIDKQKLEAIYSSRGGLSSQGQAMVYGSYEGQAVINNKNSGELLNLLWAFGLSNKNPILKEGPMNDPRYGNAGQFASTGGWTISNGNSMNHYDIHQFATLTNDQQVVVERAAKNIYRPCCGNSTYFPDCNHGMAMLGLLELMAANGVSEKDMYQTALAVNSYWFPDTYITLAKYFKTKGLDWNKVDPKTALGADYSSAQGFQAIKAQVAPAEKKSSGGCGV